MYIRPPGDEHVPPASGAHGRYPLDVGGYACEEHHPRLVGKRDGLSFSFFAPIPTISWQGMWEHGIPMQSLYQGVR